MEKRAFNLIRYYYQLTKYSPLNNYNYIRIFKSKVILVVVIILLIIIYIIS